MVLLKRGILLIFLESRLHFLLLFKLRNIFVDVQIINLNLPNRLFASFTSTKYTKNSYFIKRNNKTTYKYQKTWYNLTTLHIEAHVKP